MALKLARASASDSFTRLDKSEIFKSAGVYSSARVLPAADLATLVAKDVKDDDKLGSWLDKLENQPLFFSTGAAAAPPSVVAPSP
jgi:DNA-binding Lrp family transcriptional regulator